MTKGRSGLWIGGAGAVLAASAAQAQSGNGASPVITAPGLENFQLPQQRAAPRAPAPEPIQVAPPLPPINSLRPAAPTPTPAQTQNQRQAPPPAAVRPAPSPAANRAAPPPGAAQRPPSLESQLPAVPRVVVPPAGQAAPAAPTPTSQSAPPPAAESAPISIPGEAAPPSDGGPGRPVWIATLAAALLALLGLVWLWRRRARRGAAPELEQEEAPPPPAPAAPPQPSAERPWLEIELRAERATFNQAETLVQFELDINNAGARDARNVRIDVKLFNAGAEQDQEIGAFFRTAGRERARVNLPGVQAGVSGTIRGEVGITREEMKALQLDERLLYIPVIAVNVLYDWGDGRTGQTSKSYVVGRELQTQSEKMGAFRVDQGPRVWRTVGQRQHKLARRL